MPAVVQSDPGYGVYFRRQDYAGFGRRLLIVVADGLVAAGFCIPLATALWAVIPSEEQAAAVTLPACAIVLFFYFVALKRSRIGTLGYRIGGVRIVGLDGQPPGWFALTVRLLFAALGPVGWLLDMLWLSGDPHRQALRDKLAQTYVVRRHAQPAGTGRVVYSYCDICFYNFLFREVQVQPPEKR